MRSFLFVLAIWLVFVPQSVAQTGPQYYWAHKTCYAIDAPPWRCSCYSISAEGLIMGTAQNQTWPVSRHETFETAVAAHNLYSSWATACQVETCDDPFGEVGGAVPAAGGGIVIAVGVSVLIFENCSGSECTIGIADESFASPDSPEYRAGWRPASGQFATHADAWNAACDWHQNHSRYNAPDIAEGVIDCAVIASIADDVTSPRENGGNDGENANAATSQTDGTCAVLELVPNAGTPGYNDEIVENTSLSQCQQMCADRSWCKSVDYKRAEGTCYIQPVSMRDHDLRRDYPGNPYDHYSCVDR